MLGYIDDIMLHNLYSHSDVYLSASQSEACNLSLIEAASYRIPIITTDVGASKDLFPNEAVFLDRYCTSRDIVEAVSKTIGKPRIEYEAIQQVNWNKAMEELLAFYDNIVNKNQTDDRKG